MILLFKKFSLKNLFFFLGKVLFPFFPFFKFVKKKKVTTIERLTNGLSCVVHNQTLCILWFYSTEKYLDIQWFSILDHSLHVNVEILFKIETVFVSMSESVVCLRRPVITRNQRANYKSFIKTPSVRRGIFLPVGISIIFPQVAHL